MRKFKVFTNLGKVVDSVVNKGILLTKNVSNAVITTFKQPQNSKKGSRA